MFQAHLEEDKTFVLLDDEDEEEEDGKGDEQFLEDEPEEDVQDVAG